MNSSAGTRKSARAAFLFLILSLLLLAPASAASPKIADDEVPQNQRLAHDQKVLSMYGSRNGQDDWRQWTGWSHAASSDGNSDDTFSETGLQPGSPNNGGGMREFFFQGKHANNETLIIDKDQQIAGFITLDIICNGACSLDVTVRIIIGSYEDSANLMPDETGGNKYSFNFTHSIDEMKPGQVVDMRISFQKPGGVLDGYTLYLGPGNTQIEIPVLPPDLIEVPNLDLAEGETYASPYASLNSGFTRIEANQPALIGPILTFVLLIGIYIAYLVFAPPFPMKILGSILIIIGLFTSMVLLPIISGQISIWLAADENAVNVLTIEEILSSESNDQRLFGFEPGEQFVVVLDYDDVFLGQTGGKPYWGLGFEEYGDLLGPDADASYRVREQLQLYFSLLSYDPAPGSLLTIDVRVVNDTDAGRAVPQWALPKAGNKNLSLGNGLGYRWAVPLTSGDGQQEISALHGTDISWALMPLLSVPLGIAISSWGIWRWVKNGGFEYWRTGIDPSGNWEEWEHDEIDYDEM